MSFSCTLVSISGVVDTDTGGSSFLKWFYIHTTDISGDIGRTMVMQTSAKLSAQSVHAKRLDGTRSVARVKKNIVGYMYDPMGR